MSKCCWKRTNRTIIKSRLFSSSTTEMYENFLKIESIQHYQNNYFNKQPWHKYYVQLTHFSLSTIFGYLLYFGMIWFYYSYWLSNSFDNLTNWCYNYIYAIKMKNWILINSSFNMVKNVSQKDENHLKHKIRMFESVILIETEWLVNHN